MSDKKDLTGSSLGRGKGVAVNSRDMPKDSMGWEGWARGHGMAQVRGEGGRLTGPWGRGLMSQ